MILLITFIVWLAMIEREYMPRLDFTKRGYVFLWYGVDKRKFKIICKKK